MPRTYQLVMWPSLERPLRRFQLFCLVFHRRKADSSQCCWWGSWWHRMILWSRQSESRRWRSRQVCALRHRSCAVKLGSPSWSRSWCQAWAGTSSSQRLGVEAWCPIADRIRRCSLSLPYSTWSCLASYCCPRTISESRLEGSSTVLEVAWVQCQRSQDVGQAPSWRK